MIEFRNVTKVYGDSDTAVSNISFQVGEGEVFGLIGTSGCGKTTTLKMINRLVEPTAGEIQLAGTDVTQRPPEQLRRRIGYVIQSIGLFPHYTVRENVEVVPTLLEWDKDRISRRSNELLELVGLDPGTYGERMPDALSGGQQQRVGLARALAGDPEVMLMDEPFGALDPLTREHIRTEFKSLLQKIRKTVVLVTHDVFEAFDLCDRICLMDDGRVRQTGTPKELLFEPADKFVQSFFDHHRMQLEMMSVTVGEIADRLASGKESRSEPTTDRQPREISAGDFFYTVFEGQGGEGLFTFEHEGRKMVCDADELLTGFQELRRSLKKGGGV